MTVMLALLLVAGSQQGTIQFKKPSDLPELSFSGDESPAPKFVPPKGYKSVQVPDYIADTYMRFATAETAHDYRLLGIETRLGTLESEREKSDRPDIDSLKDTRTKALIYLAIGSTAFTILWTVIVAFITWVFKDHVSPKLRNLWRLLDSPAPSLGYTGVISTVTGNADTKKTAD